MSPNDSPRPNVLLINVDDLGWTDLGFMGSTFYETPRLDQFAAGACVFPNAYAAAPNCAPSRACMLTGRYPGVHGVYTVGNPDRGEAATRRLIPVPNQEYISEDLPTLATCLGELGYHCGMIGKWHLSDDPLRHGFHENVAGCHRGSPKRYFAPYENPAIEDGPDGEYLPERLAKEAVDFLRRHQDEPFFLYYSTYLVHTPITGKDDLIRKYTEKLERGGGDEDHNNPVYAAMIEALDEAVGTVLDALRDQGLEENTLVIFVSDNGGIRAISRQTPLRAGKGSLYEGGVRVPLAIRWPGHLPAGSTSRRRAARDRQRRAVRFHLGSVLARYRRAHSRVGRPPRESWRSLPARGRLQAPDLALRLPGPRARGAGVDAQSGPRLWNGRRHRMHERV